MKHTPIELPQGDAEARIQRLERQLARERKARIDAEAIAERGLRELYESQVRLALLQRITDCANRSNDVDEVLRTTIVEICGHMSWDFGNALRVDPVRRAVSACDIWHVVDPDRLFGFVEASRAATYPHGTGLPGRVIRDGHPHWVDSFEDAEWFVRRPEALACGLRSACAFPIAIGDEILAVIEFFSLKPMADKDTILLTIGQAGTQVARVIERDRARAALVHDALHDAMTGLPNRVLLEERARIAFDRLPPHRNGLAKLVIDLDGFKAINDKYGHHAGDAVLIEAAKRFTRTIELQQAASAARGNPWHATLARIGGDEFMVLLDAFTDPATPENIANAMHEALRLPITVDADRVMVGASIGIAHSSAYYADVEQIRRDADLAMYEAKSSGRGGVVTFSEALGIEARNRMALERELRDAIRERQFVLHYQPIFELGGDGKLKGYEALIRWHHPERGLIDPGSFIPTAEASGLIVFIGDWVLRQACIAMARMHAEYPRIKPPFVSINIAPQQFLQPDFAQHVRRVLAETGVPPDCLRLEVTEGVAIIDPQRTREVLEEIRGWGVRTSLDDFGTGYSSLSYLQNLPFDTLKIDRSFVASMHDPKSRNIIRAILDLAVNLDISVVAEGIESREQGEELVAMGCAMGQGYHLGRPLEEAAAFALLREESRAAA